MKDTYYFSHDYNAKSDPNICKMRVKYKARGYGLYWMIIEILYQEPEHRISMDYFDALALQIQEKEQDIKQFVMDCIEIGLFKSDDKFFWSDAVLERIQKRDEKSSKAQQSAKVRWNKKNANALQTECNGNAIKERKVKERIVKETTASKIDSETKIELQKSVEPAEVADVVGGDEDFREFEKLRARITGNIFPSPKEIQAMSAMLKLLPISQIKALIEAAFKAYKPQYKGDRIRAITYFLPLIQEAAATIQSRAAPEPQHETVEQSQESQELTNELINLIPEWMAKEAMHDG